jgi:cytochrome c biogenesis protein CcdA/thiol-disulfide isomerase/thioredoxin
MSLLIASFLGGILTVFTPCVFLLLPTILAGNLLEKKNYNQLITISSLIIFVFLSTLVLKFSSLFLYVGEGFWTNLSAFVLVFLGLTYIFPSLWVNQYLGKHFSNLGNKFSLMGRLSSPDSVWRPVMVGFALTPIFASCSPVYFLLLASVLPVNLYLGSLYILSYCIGIGLALYIVGNVGQKLLLNINQKFVENMKFKILVGLLFVLIGVLVFTGFDKKIEVTLPTPEVVKQLDEKIINNSQVLKEKEMIMEESKKEIVDTISKSNQPITLPNYGTAKELEGITGYINVEPGTKLHDILQKNKVVLFEFWTYSCINCKRTIPYLNSWYEKHHDKGFEIVSVHTPEFAFEKVRDNVVKNSQEQGVKFPIFMDNDFATWNAYNNRYWPMRFLILPTGQIIYQHAGEGDYENNENLIKYIIENK